MMITRIATAATLAFCAATSQAAQVTAFSWDFDNAVASAAGIGYSITNFSGLQTSTQGFNGVGGFAGNFSRSTNEGSQVSSTLSLSLVNLPAHTGLDVNFLLALIDSWDSDNGSPAPDHFNVRIDGNVVLQLTCNNASGSNCYGGTVVAPMAHRGFNGSWQDIGYDMAGESALSIAHTGSSALIELFASGNGWQGGSDESWGVDNLSVVLTTRDGTVPLPGTLALVGLGLLALSRRRAR